MTDICACLDKKCPSRTLCYRFTCKKDKHWQSYFDGSPRKAGEMKCEMFWDNEGNLEKSKCSIIHPELRKKRTSLQEYNKICNEIIASGKSWEDIFVELLDTASKYTLKGAKKPKIQLKVCKKRRKCSRTTSTRNRK